MMFSVIEWNISLLTITIIFENRYAKRVTTPQHNIRQQQKINKMLSRKYALDSPRICRPRRTDTVVRRRIASTDRNLDWNLRTDKRV